MQETLSTDSSNSDVDDEQSSEVDTSEDSSEEESKVNCHIGGSCKGCKHVDQMLSTQHPPHPAKTSPYGLIHKYYNTYKLCQIIYMLLNNNL